MGRLIFIGIVHGCSLVLWWFDFENLWILLTDLHRSPLLGFPGLVASPIFVRRFNGIGLIKRSKSRGFKEFGYPGDFDLNHRLVFPNQNWKMSSSRPLLWNPQDMNQSLLTGLYLGGFSSFLHQEIVYGLSLLSSSKLFLFSVSVQFRTQSETIADEALGSVTGVIPNTGFSGPADLIGHEGKEGSLSSLNGEITSSFMVNWFYVGETNRGYGRGSLRGDRGRRGFYRGGARTDRGFTYHRIQSGPFSSRTVDDGMTGVAREEAKISAVPSVEVTAPIPVTDLSLVALSVPKVVDRTVISGYGSRGRKRFCRSGSRSGQGPSFRRRPESVSSIGSGLVKGLDSETLRQAVPGSEAATVSEGQSSGAVILGEKSEVVLPQLSSGGEDNLWFVGNFNDVSNNAKLDVMTGGPMEDGELINNGTNNDLEGKMDDFADFDEIFEFGLGDEFGEDFGGKDKDGKVALPKLPGGP